MKKICLLFLTVTMSLLYSLNAFAQQLQLPGDCSYILIDSKAGQVIAEYNADKKRRPASTTKVMTAIIALENGNLNAGMKVSKEAVYDIGEDGMNIGIMPGEENLTLENLLNAMLIKSANETANIIAENICESRSEFIDKMNEKAVALGALNTHFVNTCGKDDTKEEANHLSTARDMAAIARYAMTLPKFREIVGKEYYNDMPATNKHQKWDVLRTTNKLLWYTNQYSYSLNGQNKLYTVNGIKTGYTSAAGNNLICSAVDDNGMELIAVIMHVTDGNIFSHAKELFKYGFEHFSNQKVIDGNRIIKTIEVQDAEANQKLDLVTASNLICALPIEENSWNIEVNENINQIVKAPIRKGDILGYIEYKRNGVLLDKVDVIASQAVEKKQNEIIKDKAKSVSGRLPVIKVLTVVLALFVLFLCLRIFLRNFSRKVNKRRSGIHG